MSAWRLGDENCGGGLNVHAVVAGENVVVAWTGRVVVGGVEVLSGAQARANAEDIARRHNAHEDLVAALREAAERLAEAANYVGPYGDLASRVLYDRLALAAAAARAGVTT